MSLSNIIQEKKKIGLASEFTIECQFCKYVNTIKTSDNHKSGSRGPQAYDINSRAVLGALYTGIGHTHLTTVLTTMNVPSINHTTFKTREREVGKAVENISKRSCKENLEKEKSQMEMR